MLFSGFSGGAHPPQKKLTRNSEFVNFPVPGTCYISLLQHIGAPAEPVVAAGDVVEEGQLIGKAIGVISADVHASVPGRVLEIKEMQTVYGPGQVVVIESGGSFNTSKTDSSLDLETLSKEDVLSAIKDAGIVGLGGAAFPTIVKLTPPESATIDTLIVNGAECEPYVTVDDMLMRTFADDIIMGVRITLKGLGINRAIIGVENNKPEAVKSLQAAIKRINAPENISVKALHTKYPQGAEKQLIYSLTKRKVPSGGLPMNIGVVVQNVGTIAAIREAVLLKKPLYERYLTVAGSLVENPGNYKVRIGTMISEIVNNCGGLKEAPAKILLGGPMCGVSLPSMDIPIVKGTTGLLFLSEKETFCDTEYRACIRCGKCVSTCPIGLLPCDLGTTVETRRFDLSDALNPLDCIMCGTCAYGCPSRRPLTHFIKIAQNHLKTKK